MKKILACFWLLFCQLYCSNIYAEKSVSYDLNGNVSRYIAPHAGEISYSYDPINRLTATHYPHGKTIQYAYDYSSNLTQVVDHRGTTTYSYDALNRLTQAQLPGKIALTYEYDLANRLVKIVYPDQEAVTYDYDKRGRLIQVCDTVGITHYAYDDATNLVTQEKLPNGIVTTYSYDDFPRITTVSHHWSNGDLITEYQFTYNSNSHCTSIQETTPDGTKTIRYTYDPLHRLIEVSDSNGYFEKYTYDGAGNRLAKTTPHETIDYEYDHANRLIRSGKTRFHYDASGNLIKKTSPEKTVLLSYDPAGKLISYDNGKDKVLFNYDGEGRRISKTVNGKTIFFINDPAAPLSRVLLEKDEQGKTQKRYVYGCSRLFAQSPTGHHFFLYDQPGKSVAFLTDRKERVIESYSYTAFGVTNEGDFSANSYGYAGEEYDEETGLIYLRNRYYDPEIGRFTSPDTVLGILGDPQTLNSYVYARNNPVNYIDPAGLYAIKVPLTFYGNFPGARTRGGKSRAGHGWMGGIEADGNEFNQGAWLDDVRPMHYDDDIMSLCPETVSLTVWVAPELQAAARQAGNYPRWTPYDNCIDHVVKSLDAIGYPHPSFKASSIGISDPIIFCNWIKQENKHIDPRFMLGPDDVVPYLHTPQLSAIDSHSFFFRPNYGGVSLSKSAELMTNISDISGAIFDQKTGQLILYGKKDLPLPPMHLDDLAVAVRSVYGLGGKVPQDPGISMDYDPNTLHKRHSRMVVTYYGETQNTRFGQVMFNADRLLKNLILGKDNETGKKFKAHVQGYRNLLDRYARDGRPPSEWSWRMWFVPEKITLAESQDGTSMTFDQVRMQVLTETKFRGRMQDDHAAEKFADHLTHNYDSYASEFAILHDLKRLGRITAVVKWMKEHEIPIDLSFFKNHVPQFVVTPLETPQIKNVEHGFAQISGGVVYHLDANNFAKVTSSYPSQTRDEILQARPYEENLSWDFGRGYTAVAQTIAKSPKVGDITKTFVDMSFPLPGPFPLALIRTYNSFNTDRSGFGVGWDITPAKLRFPSVKQWMRFSDETVHQAHAEVFVCSEGKETPYKIFSMDGSGRPLYRPEGQPFYLIENGEGTFSLFKQHIEFLFSSDGRLTRIIDSRGVTIDYAYDAGRLVSISYKGKKAIHLEYAGDRIIRVIGLGDKVIDYDYTPEGQLKSVRDSAGVLATYDYDQDLRLTAIFDGKGEPIFKAQYDIYNRAEEKVVNGAYFKQQFSLSERRARIEGSSSFFIEEQFDDHYRPQTILDALGRRLELHYNSSFGPEKSIDHNGLEVLYAYDDWGRPVQVYDEYRGLRQWAFDDQGNILQETDGRGIATAYCYDEKKRLSKMYHPFYCNFFQIKDGRVTTQGDERFATTFHYDPTTGELASIDLPGGRCAKLKLNDDGLPVEIEHPNGMITEKAYDHRLRLKKISQGRKAVRYTYDERDRIIKISSPFGEITYSYDLAGNVVSKTDPLGLTSTFEYDEHDHLVKVVDALGGVSFYEYNALGDLTKMTLPNGSVREIHYDEFERPIVMR